MVEVYKTLINDSPHFDAGARVPSDMLPLDSDGTLFIDLSEKKYGGTAREVENHQWLCFTIFIKQ